MHVFSAVEHGFWRWFVSVEDTIRTTFVEAARHQDYVELEALANAIASRLVEIDPDVTVQVAGGNEVFRLAISGTTPSASELAESLLASAPSLNEWSFGSTIELPPTQIIVRDETGRELALAYDALQFTLLPQQSDGSTTVVFALDDDFDPRGPLGHLYRAAATEVLNYTFGGPPPGIGSYAVFPAIQLSGWNLRPLGELEEAWRER